MEVGKSVPLQSLSTDFEVFCSPRKVISSIETVALKKVDTTDVKDDTLNPRFQSMQSYLSSFLQKEHVENVNKFQSLNFHIFNHFIARYCVSITTTFSN